MGKIRIAIVGIGNCASSLVQGIHYYTGKKAEEAAGLLHWEIGGDCPGDIQVSARRTQGRAEERKPRRPARSE